MEYRCRSGLQVLLLTPLIVLILKILLCSVSAKTNYLINNEAMSASSKNKKAKQLGVEIVTEEVFLERWCKDIEQ